MTGPCRSTSQSAGAAPFLAVSLAGSPALSFTRKPPATESSDAIQHRQSVWRVHQTGHTGGNVGVDGTGDNADGPLGTGRTSPRWLCSSANDERTATSSADRNSDGRSTRANPGGGDAEDRCPVGGPRLSGAGRGRGRRGGQ